MSVISYLTPLGKREARLRLSLILEHLNIKINKAAKKDPAKELLKLERKLSAELVKNWRESYTDALRDLFKNLPSFISQDAKKIIEDSLLDALGVSFGSAKNVRLLMRERIEDAYILGKSLFNLNKDLKSALSLSDRKAIDVLTRHNCFWLGEHYGKHIGPKISELTQQALDEGLGRDALAENLKQELGSVSPKGYSYFDVVASSALVRARSFGSIAGMEEAGIAEYEILAMGDERTCPICGEMNGKKFSVAQTREVIDKVLDIKDPEKFKEAMPWQTEPPKNKSESKLSEDGQSLPPFHGRCRCTLVMTESYVEPESASIEVQDVKPPQEDNINLENQYYSRLEDLRNKIIEAKQAKSKIQTKVLFLMTEEERKEYDKLQNEILRAQRGIKQLKLEAAENGVIFASGLSKTLDKADVDEIIRLVKKAPPEVRKVWNLYEGEMQVGDVNVTGTQHYSPRTKDVHLNIFKNRIDSEYKVAHETTFHELGHLIDHACTGFYKNNSKDEEYNLYAVLTSEVDSYIKGTYDRLRAEAIATGKSSKEIKKKDAYEAVEKELFKLPKYARIDISDTFSGCTFNKVKNGGYHPTSYWKSDPELVCLEFFAENFSALTVNPESLEMIKKYFPKSHKIFKQMLDDIIEESE
ncbi:MAG: minor capsid protein [Synergistaceae bacterium]|nr:minor capsid protein [Synergistaceae bacterium]